MRLVRLVIDVSAQVAAAMVLDQPRSLSFSQTNHIHQDQHGPPTGTLADVRRARHANVHDLQEREEDRGD